MKYQIIENKKRGYEPCKLPAGELVPKGWKVTLTLWSETFRRRRPVFIDGRFRAEVEQLQVYRG